MKHTLRKKPTGNNFDIRYIVNNIDGEEVFSITSERLWDSFRLIPKKEKVIEIFQNATLSVVEKDAIKFLIDEVYPEFYKTEKVPWNLT